MKRIGKNKALSLLEKGAFLVDMRTPVAFRDGHVSGAVNLPLRNFVNKIMGMDRKSKLVIYSESLDDADLKQGHNYAETLGFTEVFVSDYKSLTEDAPALNPRVVMVTSNVNGSRSSYLAKKKTR